MSLQPILYFLYFGFIFYDGGKYWAAALGRSKTVAQKWGRISVILVLAEFALMLLIAMFTSFENDQVNWYDPIMIAFYLFLLHLTICVTAIVMEFLGWIKIRQ